MVVLKVIVMSANTAFFASLAKTGGALGKGLIAGLAGTMAITVSQMIEMKITHRSMSNAPSTVGGKTLGVEPRGQAELETEKEKSSGDDVAEKTQHKVEANQEKFNYFVHFGYGTGWGVARGVLDLAGIRGLAADLAHFGAIWGTALVMLPSATKTKPITEWPPKQIAIDMFHHGVYACAAGCVYDAMCEAEVARKKKWWFF